MLFKEKLGTVYAMVLYSLTRWTSVNYMLQSLTKVIPAITLFQYPILNEREELGIDPKFELPADPANLLSSQQFWTNIQLSVNKFDPVSICVEFLESDTCTMGDVYACFV